MGAVIDTETLIGEDVELVRLCLVSGTWKKTKAQFAFERLVSALRVAEEERERLEQEIDAMDSRRAWEWERAEAAEGTAQCRTKHAQDRVGPDITDTAQSPPAPKDDLTVRDVEIARQVAWEVAQETRESPPAPRGAVGRAERFAATGDVGVLLEGLPEHPSEHRPSGSLATGDGK